MSDNMNDKNENIDKTMVDEAVVDKTAEAEASETVDDAAIGDIAADESSADSIESIDFTVVYDDDNAAVAGNDTADAAETADAANNAADDTNDDSDVAVNNANQVKETLALRSSDAPTALETHEAVKADSATSVSSQLDNEIKRNRKKDAFFFKANPTFALDHVTVTNRKTGRNILDDLSLSFHAGATHAVLVDAEDREQHQALLATMVGMVRTDRGNVMHKSANRRTGRNVGTPHRIHSATFCFPPRSRRGKQCAVRHGCVKPQLPQAEACDRPRTAQARGLR